MSTDEARTAVARLRAHELLRPGMLPGARCLDHGPGLQGECDRLTAYVAEVEAEAMAAKRLLDEGHYESGGLTARVIAERDALSVENARLKRAFSATENARVLAIGGERFAKQQLAALRVQLDAASGVVRGLKRLADHLPTCGDDADSIAQPGCDCGYDEIMELARAFLASTGLVGPGAGMPPMASDILDARAWIHMDRNRALSFNCPAEAGAPGHSINCNKEAVRIAAIGDVPGPSREGACQEGCDAIKCSERCWRATNHGGLHRCGRHGGDIIDADIPVAPKVREEVAADAAGTVKGAPDSTDAPTGATRTPPPPSDSTAHAQQGAACGVGHDFGEWCKQGHPVTPRDSTKPGPWPPSPSFQGMLDVMCCRFRDSGGVGCAEIATGLSDGEWRCDAHRSAPAQSPGYDGTVDAERLFADLGLAGGLAWKLNHTARFLERIHVRSAPEPTPTQSPEARSLVNELSQGDSDAAAKAIDEAKTDSFRRGWEAARAEAGAIAAAMVAFAAKRPELSGWLRNSVRHEIAECEQAERRSASTIGKSLGPAEGGALLARAHAEARSMWGALLERLAALPSALPTTKETT